MNMDEKRLIALKDHYVKNLNYSLEEVESLNFSPCTLSQYGFKEISASGEVLKTFRVLTFEETEEAFEEALENYLDNVIWPELTDFQQQYFDCEKWKHDQRVGGAKGDFLAHHDNEGHEVLISTLDGNLWFNIYRTN